MSRPRGTAQQAGARLALAVRSCLSGIEDHEPLVVACSGGRDSMGLLGLLIALGYGQQLRVLHCDHGLRVGSSKEGAFVVEHCRSLGVQAESVKLEVVPHHPKGPQAGAREVRLAAYLKHMKAKESRFLLTGHHARDRAETLLQLLLRGRPLGAPILPQRATFPGSPDRFLLRPLVLAEESDRLTWIDQQAVPWLEDPSNQESRYQRNRIRQEITPTLDRFDEAWVRGFSRACEPVCAPPQWEEMGRPSWVLDRHELRTLARPKRQQGIWTAAAAVQRQGEVPGVAAVLLLGKAPAPFQLHPATLHRMEALVLAGEEAATDLGQGLRLRLGPRRAIASLQLDDSAPGPCQSPIDAHVEQADRFDIVRLALQCRTRPLGVATRLLVGGPGREALGRRSWDRVLERLRRAGVPRGLRGDWPLLLDGDGVVRVAGLEPTLELEFQTRAAEPSGVA